MKHLSTQIEANRDQFLEALRSGKYKKGTIRSDEKGYPIIESEEENDGHCACAIMLHEFPDEFGRESIVIARKALGISRQDCRFIQHEINDTPLSFPAMADRIEVEIFKRIVSEPSKI